MIPSATLRSIGPRGSPGAGHPGGGRPAGGRHTAQRGIPVKQNTYTERKSNYRTSQCIGASTTLLLAPTAREGEDSATLWVVASVVALSTATASSTTFFVIAATTALLSTVTLSAADVSPLPSSLQPHP
jgi:hypothetical protein